MDESITQWMNHSLNGKLYDKWLAYIIRTTANSNKVVLHLNSNVEREIFPSGHVTEGSFLSQ